MDFPFAETFPPRKQPQELSQEAQNKLYEYHVEKSKRPHDWHWKEAEMISGSADYSPRDEGEAPTPITE